MTEFSFSLPDNLMRALRKAARGDVSAFVAEAVRKELARRHLGSVLREMEAELGPPDEARIAEIGAMFAEINEANTVAEKCGDEDS